MMSATWRVLGLALALAVASACTPAASPTPTPTAASKATPSTPAATPSAAPKGAATATPTQVAGAPQLPRFEGVIDSVARCFTANDLVKTLDLPRQIQSVSPAQVKDGDSITISAAGYRPRTALEVRVFIPGTGRISQPLGQTLSDEGGRASLSFTLANVRLLNDAGDTKIPVCLGVVLWSPTETAGSTVLMVPAQ